MANRNSLTFILLVVASCTGVMAKDFVGSPCIENWLRVLAVPADCAAASAGDKAVDPSDCTKFFLCTGDGTMLADSFSCGEDFDCFDPTAGKCIVEDGTKCADACAGNAQGCVTECAALGDNIADITDCNRHYLCLGDATAGKIELYCPDERPHFNGKECVNDKGACCNCQTPTCAAAGDLLADPENCHAFYACADLDGSGTFTPLGPTACTGGGSFVNGKCDASVTDCENICDLGGDSTMTPSSDSTTSASDSTTGVASSTMQSSDSTMASSDSTMASSDSTMASSDSTIASSDSTMASSDSSTTSPSGTDCKEISSFNCPANGYYARCSYCDPSYFKCALQGATPTVGYCAGELVFNPTPEYPYCVRPENCPFGLY